MRHRLDRRNSAYEIFVREYAQVEDEIRALWLRLLKEQQKMLVGVPQPLIEEDQCIHSHAGPLREETSRCAQQQSRPGRGTDQGYGNREEIRYRCVQRFHDAYYDCAKQPGLCPPRFWKLDRVDGSEYVSTRLQVVQGMP